MESDNSMEILQSLLLLEERRDSEKNVSLQNYWLVKTTKKVKFKGKII